MNVSWVALKSKSEECNFGKVEYVYYSMDQINKVPSLMARFQFNIFEIVQLIKLENLFTQNSKVSGQVFGKSGTKTVQNCTPNN